jgi:ferredoxin-like protein FixX
MSDVCLNHCPNKICTIFCPAGVYKWEEIRMYVGYEGCHDAEAAGLDARIRISSVSIRKAGIYCRKNIWKRVFPVLREK